MEVPQKNCMVYNNGISFEHGWFRCTPISGNLHMLEKGLKHVAWWMSRWNWWTRGWPARLKHETGVESFHIYVRLLGNHWKPSKTIIKAICRYGSGLHDWWRREPGHDDTMTRWNDDNNNTSNSKSNSNNNSSSSTTAPTVPRWQPWRSTSCWWCRKRRQERRSPLGHKSGWMDDDDDGWLNDAEWFWMEEGTGRWKKREVKGISSLGTGLQWYAWYRLIARFEISKKSCCPFTTKVLDVMDLLRSKRGKASCLNGIPTRLQRQRLQKWPDARC